MPDGYMPRFLSREGLVLPGERRGVIVPPPAAGADWSVQVPGGRQWRIQGATFTLVTSAAVANRFQVLARLVDGLTVAFVGNSSAIAASSTSVGIMDPGTTSISSLVSGNIHMMGAPQGWLQPGDVLAAQTTNLQAGDQWSNILLDVEECWLDDQELTILEEERLAALGLQPVPWARTTRPGG